MKNNVIIKLFQLLIVLVAAGATHAQIITTVAGTGEAGYSGDGGAAVAAKLMSPHSLVVTAVGDIYFSELESSTIRKISASGIISTLVGANGAGYSGDGGAATAAKILYPGNMGIDAAGNIYIADWGNNVIRKINTKDTITTVAGNHLKGYSGDGGPAIAARLNGPNMYVTPAGTIYISELENHRIRRVSNGNITTVAGFGQPGSSPDGTPAASAAMNPYAVTVDTAGNIYYVDEVNPVYRVIRKIDAVKGTISTYSPYWAQAMIFGADGFMYFSDEGCYVRKVTYGSAHAYTGNGVCIASGDSGLAKVAGINTPLGLAFDPARNLFVAERNGARIRKITYYDPAVGINESPVNTDIRVFPNPATEAFTVELPVMNREAVIEISDMTGRIAELRKAAAGAGISEKFYTHTLPPGAYLIKVTAGDRVYREKVLVR